MLKRCFKRAQALIEYAMLLGLIAITAVFVVKATGTKTSSALNNIQSQMSSQDLSSAPVMGTSGASGDLGTTGPIQDQ